MAEDKEKKLGLFSPNLANLLLIVVAGTLFVGQDSFHESRPDKTQTVRQPIANLQDVEARMWQDPFDAIDFHKPGQLDLLKTADGTSLTIQSASSLSDKCAEKTVDHKHCQSVVVTNILEKFKNANDDKLNSIQSHRSSECTHEKINRYPELKQACQHTVLAVMLPGGAYFEDTETRRRLRYAVLSGVYAALDYTPQDDEHIGYFVHKQQDENASKTKKPDTESKVAFEWLVWKPKISVRKDPQSEVVNDHPPILLLYLNADNFGYNPYQKLQNLFGIFITPAASEWNINVLGPTSSDMLQEMALEVGESKKASKQPPNFKLYSPVATVDEPKLLDYLSGFVSDDTSKAEEFEKYFNDRIGPGFFTRTTSTDPKMAEALAKELVIRGVKALPSQSYNNPLVGGKIDTNIIQSGNKTAKGKHVVLISEKENLYGWHIGKTYAEEVTWQYLDCDSESKKEKWLCIPENQQIYAKTFIHQYSYFRGLDGERPHKMETVGANQETIASAGIDSSSKAAQAKQLEDADGDSQFDYIRRLVDKLEQLNQELEQDGDGIGAVGILGSDVYDKLLVLEALHEKFPYLLYFTNGIDARFLHPDQNKWARNLIVVSSFGLELTTDLQKDIPPFRSSTQTSYFWATQMALAKSLPENQLSLDSECLKKYKNSFDVHLIYNSECLRKSHESLVDIQFKMNKQESGLNVINRYYVDHPNLHEIGRTQAFPLMPEVGFYDSEACNNCQYNSSVPISKLLTLLTICVISPLLVWIYFSQAKSAPKNTSHKNYILSKQQISSVIFLSIGFLVAAYLVCFSHIFGLSEPFAWFEGVSMWPSEALRYIAFILSVHYLIEVINFPRLIKEQLTKDFKMNWYNVANPQITGYVELKKLLDDIENNQTKNCLYVFVVLIFFGLFIYSYGGTNIPYRGDMIFYFDRALMVILVVLFMTLLVWVCNIVQKLADCLQSMDDYLIWPPALHRHYRLLLNIKGNTCNDWATIQVVSELTECVSKLIFYPFIVASVIMLARMSYFDNWVIRPGLLTIFQLIFISLFYCDYRLKVAAEGAGKNAVKRLRSLLIQQQGGSMPCQNVAQQLEQLIFLAKVEGEGIYKPFVQRPIFQGCLLMILAIALGFSDYSDLVMKLLK